MLEVLYISYSVVDDQRRIIPSSRTGSCESQYKPSCRSCVKPQSYLLLAFSTCTATFTVTCQSQLCCIQLVAVGHGQHSAVVYSERASEFINGTLPQKGHFDVKNNRDKYNETNEKHAKFHQNQIDITTTRQT